MSIFEKIWDGMGQRAFLGWAWSLGSGYSKPMKNLAVLIDSICEAYDMVWLDGGPFAPKEGVTHCNEAVQYVAKKFGYIRFAGKMANEIVDVLNNDRQWERVAPQDAAERAAEGRLVIAAQKGTPHGHVCIVRPGTLESSGKWKAKVPKVLNVGKDCFLSKGSNFAFRDMPGYYSLEG